MHERLIHIRKNPDAVFGLVLNGGIRKVHEGTSTHMDVAPTVLALAGIKTNAKFLDGKDLLGNSQPARNINLASLPKEVLDEFGLLRAPDYAQRGIIYKHTSSDAYEYIRANEIPFQERDGIRGLSYRNPKLQLAKHLSVPRIKGLRHPRRQAVRDVFGPGWRTCKVRFHRGRSGYSCI